MPSTSIDVRALSTAVQQAVVPLFWGAIALAALAPVAAAGGVLVAEKITGGSNREKERK